MPDGQIDQGSWTPDVLGVPPDHTYSVVIDAGSSKTQLEVFFQQNLSAVPLEDDELELLKGDKLTLFMDTPCKAVPLIQELLFNTTKVIPPLLMEQADTPVWLRGTAGLRLEEPEKVDAIIECMNKELVGGTNFAWQDAKIASGDMEAIYALLSVRQRFGNGTGVVEMGGASAQVSFRPSTSILNSEFVINGNESVYAKSYQKFGQDQGLLRSYEQLIKQGASASLLEAPCSLSLAHPCLPVGLETNYTFKDQTYKFHGTSDSQGCRNLALELMRLDTECTQSPCAMLGVYQPNITLFAQELEFKAVSAFYHAVNNIGLKAPGKISPGAIAAKLPSWCAKNLEQVEEAGGKEYLEYNQFACFNGWFAYSMLNSYGFPDNFMRLDFPKDTEVSWTLGALIYFTQPP